MDFTEKIKNSFKVSYEEKKKMRLSGRRNVERTFDRQIVVDTYVKGVNGI